MARISAEISIDTRLILERLGRAQIGEVVTYDELSKLIGRDVRENYGLTRTARHRLLGEKKYFEPVPGFGFKRCNDQEKVAGGGRYIAKTRRACRRGARITTSVNDYDALSKSDQVRHNTQLSLFLTLRAMSTRKKVDAIAAKVQDNHSPISMVATLAAIAKVQPITRPRIRKS